MTDVEQPPQNGIELSSATEDDDNSKSRPADIEQDMREMERRKRVEAIMGSKLFREELERIVDSARDGGILQQLSDIMGMPASRVGNVFKASNCMLPINDIRGVESMGYAKGEKILRCKLAATFRLLDLYGWTQGLGAQITARLKVDQEYFLVNPYGLLYHEITASSLNKVDMQGQIIEQGTTNFGVNKSHFMLHSVVHAARPDIRCVIYIGCGPVVAISSLKTGLLPLTKDACLLGEITTHQYTGTPLDTEERDKLVRNLGPNSKVLILSNYGALCCGETIEEAFFAACHIVQACETQLKLLPVGLDNLVLIPEESRKIIYEQSRRPPEDLEKKFAAVSTAEEDGVKDATAIKATGNAPKWRVGGAEFEALMRMLDNAGYRTGYIYRHPLIKSDPPKPKNDVELPPAVSSLGYLLEEEELLKQGIWKKGDFRKGGDRSRWLNSPNVYQKVEVLETGTPDPKKITKWVAEGSPTHSTPVRIEDPLQFVPAGTNPKEFKRLQQQIKDNRRADKISAGPQSHILEGVTWDEANRIKDATVSSAGDHVVLMGAASKGIIQRGYQHNAAVYKAPYAKNPFDNVTDDELNEYKRTVERKKKSIHGEYTDTDFSESEPLSSLQTSGAQQTKQTTTTTAVVSQSEPEDVSEHQVMRIETQQAPVPSQPEVVLSDATLNFINGERSHSATNRKPSTGRDLEDIINAHNESEQAHGHNNQCPDDTGADSIVNATTTIATVSTAASVFVSHEANKENIFSGDQNIKRNTALIAELKNDLLFQRQKHKHICNDADVGAKNNNVEIESKAEPDPDPLQSNNNSCNKNGSDSGNGNGSDGSRDGVMCLDNGILTASSCRADTDVIRTVNSTTFVVSEEDSTPRNYPFRTHACGNSSQNGALALNTFEQAYSRVVTCHPELCTVYYDPYLQYMEPVYDTAPSTLHSDNAEPTAALDDSENAYKKSIFCCTPSVCDSIFESLRKPLRNDLIFNIPFTAESPDQTSAGTTPRKTRADMTRKQPTNASPTPSPYRTVSHFGFNSPQREPQPEHKHIPCATEPKKYVPLRKSISYEEIFSSPRYVDLCENCFEKVVRLKPELVQTRTRLRNLVEFHSATADRFVGGACNAIGGPEGEGSGNNALLYPVAVEFIGSQYDYAECASSETTETLPPFSSQLEPVLEVEENEPDSAEDPLKSNMHGFAITTNVLEKSASNSSFIEKIMRLNYSEESTNVNFIPSACAVSSNITLELEKLRDDHLHLGQKDSETVLSMTETQHNNTEADAEEPSSESYAQQAGANTRRTSVTEVWEFVQWSGEDCSEKDEENCAVHRLQPGGGAMCLYYESTQAFDEGARKHVNNNDEAGDSKEANNYHSSADQHRRSLMSREERGRRKLVFQELWEDHISFLDGKEQNMLSDTESAIDGKQQQLQLQDEEDDEVTADTDGEVDDSDELCQEAMCGSEVDIEPVIRVEHVVGIEQMMAVDHVVKVEQLSVVNNRIVTNEEKDTGQGTEGTAEGNADVEEEIFLGRSLIVKTAPQADMQDAAAILGCELADEEKDIESDGCQSTQTFDISLQENLFFRASQLVDPVSDSAMPRMDHEAAALDPSLDGRYVVPSMVEGGLAFSPSIEEFHLYTQDSTVLVDQLEIVELDESDLNFTDLVSTEQQDLDRLSEDFDEILLRVENLQVANEVGEPKNSKEETEYSAAEEDENVEFDPVERKILKKIREHQLNEREEIFTKIETTIRRKLAPFELESLAQSGKKPQNINATNSFAASTPTKLPIEAVDKSIVESSFDSISLLKDTKTHMQDHAKIDGSISRNDDDDSLTLTPQSQSFNSVASARRDERNTQTHNLRRSRSLTPLSNACEISPPPRKLNKTTTPPQVLGKSTNAQTSRKLPQSTCSIPEFRYGCAYSPATAAAPAACKRNFILENIRNAAIPRNNVKRLQGSAQAIFCRSPFGPTANQLHAQSSSSSLASNVSSGTTVTTANNQTTQNYNSSGRDTSPVYTFQSKLVRGSPRFWVSMSQPTPKKLQLNRSMQKRRKKHQRQQQQCKTRLGVSDSTSTCTIDDEESAFLAVSNRSQSPAPTTYTGVDVELVALGDQIEQIQPRLETYKRKIHDYGKHVAKCSRHMDECIAVQSDIMDEHRQLREEIMFNQYADQITCQVQTFSISEAED